MRERDQLSQSLEQVQNIEQNLKDTLELLELGEMEEDQDLLNGAEKDIELLHQKVQRLRLETLLSGEADANNCFIEVHAGAGGTEAQDWALMLTRMYTRWAEANGYKIDWIEEIDGEFSAYEFKWSDKKKDKKFPKTFLDHYPIETTAVVSPMNCDEFLGADKNTAGKKLWPNFILEIIIFIGQNWKMLNKSCFPWYFNQKGDSWKWIAFFVLFERNFYWK